MKTYLVTGGAGFIGSNFILYMMKKHKDVRIINVDKLTYAGNLENLKSVDQMCIRDRCWRLKRRAKTCIRCSAYWAPRRISTAPKPCSTRGKTRFPCNG